jgi:type IV pilus assembly protein PilA
MMLNLIKKQLKNEKGLTLVELLVVIVILGIIASIAVVSIGNIIDDTKKKAKVTEAVQIINAAKLKHAAEGTNTNNPSWVSTSSTSNALSDYISNVKDTTWTVTWNKADGYEITGHDSASTVTSGADDSIPIAESAITNYLDGE